MSKQPINMATELGIFLSGSDVIVTSRKLAQLLGMEHFHILRRIRDVIELTNGGESNLGFTNCNESNFGFIYPEACFLPVQSTYFDARGRAKIEYHMTIDEAVLLQGGMSAKRATMTIALLQRQSRQLRELAGSKDRELAALARQYMLTDSEDCHNLSCVCSRFDLTPEKAYKVLLTKKILERVQNKWQRHVYRPTASSLGKGWFNLDQHTEDLRTHLKFTDKEGVKFLTDFFAAWKMEQEAARQLAAFRQPVLPGLEAAFAEVAT